MRITEKEFLSLLGPDDISGICSKLHCTESEFKNFAPLKKGMTNYSYTFFIKEKKYILRVPGEGTELLINRHQEAEVYNVIKNKKICDELVWLNPKNGIKVSEYIENVRVCNPYNETDIAYCMEKLKKLHRMNFFVSHEFNLKERIEYYESLWAEKTSIYSDYADSKKNIFFLLDWIEKLPKEKCLCHIDAVPDNFLFSKTLDGKKHIQIIDWEYAAMQDPHLDIAMFCVYALYDEKQQIDKVIDLYFLDTPCSFVTRTKIYAYIASCGLLWSNWCEYKALFGIEFGDYALRQYKFAKDYFYIALDAILHGGYDE